MRLAYGLVSLSDFCLFQSREHFLWACKGQEAKLQRGTIVCNQLLTIVPDYWLTSQSPNQVTQHILRPALSQQVRRQLSAPCKDTVLVTYLANYLINYKKQRNDEYIPARGSRQSSGSTRTGSIPFLIRCWFCARARSHSIVEPLRGSSAFCTPHQRTN